MNFRALVVSMLVAAGHAPVCAAADLYSPAPAAGWGIELRGGVFAHAVDDAPEKGSADINLELLADPLGGGAWYVPRFHIGATVNAGGDTSHAYIGATWTIDVTERLFAEFTFGGGIHDGYTGSAPPPPGQNALGCSPLFRESASLGYRLGERWSVMATVEHLSNAGLCNDNRGITNAGARVGYSF